MIKFLGGSIVSKIGYYLMNKYKVSYMVVFSLAILALINIISNIAYSVIQSNRFGFEALTTVK